MLYYGTLEIHDDIVYITFRNIFHDFIEEYSICEYNSRIMLYKFIEKLENVGNLLSTTCFNRAFLSLYEAFIVGFNNIPENTSIIEIF